MSTIEIGKYRQFFDVDEKYFPCIDDSAIKAGAAWDNTYPHETFINLLKNVERMLGGTTKRSVWIHGAYGTGKSQCAYALKRILEVPENEVVEYWNRYEPLKKNQDLLQKILGHKERKIVTAYRYASGGITTPRDLFFAIQESVKDALTKDKRITYGGEQTLKESVIAWLEDEAHKNFFNELLKKPEWCATFSQTTADQVLNSLKKSQNIKSLLDNIFSLADKEGITAMTLTADHLKDWIKDVIVKNDAKIVFVWDEFSGFFKQNRNSLDEFQKIVALCQEVPFYFIVVTHQTDSIINSEDQAWSVVRQRFEFSQITLPDNIAFELIGHAFNVKPAAKETWNVCASDLNSQLDASRREVMKAARVTDSQIIKNIMPIHPVAALVLKNIASAFQSNQRSMFDFIKTSNDSNVKAFQWYIEQYGPDDDDYPLLTVDLLWDFFYEKGRDNLAPDIRMILDTYPQQQNLREDEKRVLKTILIMQAIDKRLAGAIDLLKPTEQNISYAFEGIASGLDVSCKNLAKGLKDKGILVLNPIGNNRYSYGAAVLAGDQAKIDEYKKSVRNSSTTAKLVAEGKLSVALSLSPALRLRYEDAPNSGALITVTNADFTKTVNVLKERVSPWRMNAVVAFAKDYNEAVGLRKLIKEAAQKEEYENIVFIDALDTPLGEEELEAYVDASARAQYYQSANNGQTSRDYSGKAAAVLAVNWKNRIYNGAFYLYYSGCEEGERVIGGSGVATILQAIVQRKHEFIFDFNRGVTENQLKLSQPKPAAKCGIIQKTSGVMVNSERATLAAVWEKEGYWNDHATSNLNISVIKLAVNKLIEEGFDRDGQISIGEVYDFLENEFGFAPCNLSAFLTGFLLKEYSSEPYRYLDASGTRESMSPDKMAEMIGNYVGKNPNPTYIVKMTPEEKAFYELTERAWGIPANSCTSPMQAGISVKNKMQKLGLPIWSLEEVDATGAYEVVKKYIDLIQKEGKEAHQVAIMIGGIAQTKPSLGDQLNELIKVEKCQEGMMSFLNGFEGRKLLRLAEENGATGNVLSDICRLFSVQYSSLWNIETGKDQIRVLTEEYLFANTTNAILNSATKSYKEACEVWSEQLKFAMCSCEALQEEFPELNQCFDYLYKISNEMELLPEQVKCCVQEFKNHITDLKNYFSNEIPAFRRIYKVYLEEISDDEIPQLRGQELIGIFGKSRTDGNAIVKKIVNEFLKNQNKKKMFDLWKAKTLSKNPSDWSSKHRTPIMLMVPMDEYDAARKAFDTLNRAAATEGEIASALDFLNETNIYEDLANNIKVDEAFEKLLGSYKLILTDIEKVRDSLEKLAVDAYEWDNHPAVKNRIRELAKAEYDAGGSDKVVSMIEGMKNEELKSRLVAMIKGNMALGIEILNGGK